MSHRRETDNDKERSLERLRQAYLMDRFAGPILFDEVQAWASGIRYQKAGQNSLANPYERDDLRWQWNEGFSLSNNMNYPTMGGSTARLPRPPKGHVV